MRYLTYINLCSASLLSMTILVILKMMRGEHSPFEFSPAENDWQAINLTAFTLFGMLQIRKWVKNL